MTHFDPFFDPKWGPKMTPSCQIYIEKTTGGGQNHDFGLFKNDKNGKNEKTHFLGS